MTTLTTLLFFLRNFHDSSHKLFEFDACVGRENGCANAIVDVVGWHAVDFHLSLPRRTFSFVAVVRRLNVAMTSRIHIARPAAPPSYSSDPHGLSNSRSPSGFRSVNPSEADSFQEKLRAYSTQIEDYIEIYSQPLKPHLPSIGRFLIVVTFLEDAWRIMTQWSDQLWYLQKYVCLLLLCGSLRQWWLC